MTTVSEVAAVASAPRAWSATDVAAAARAMEAAGRPVLHLEVGEPDFPTPPHVVAAAIAALQAGRTRYAPAAGLPELREAAAETLVRRGVPTTAGHVLVGPGARLLLHCATLALLAPGDEAAVPDPGYGAYAAGVRRAGARPVAYPVRGDGTLDLDALAACVGPRTRVLFLNAPHNPTGGMLDAGALATLATIVERHDLTVISDEIYAHLAHRGAHASIATIPGLSERTIVVDGFSKRFAMTGWRLAYASVPAALVARVLGLLADTATCTPPFVQVAGVAALTGPQAEAAANARAVRERRDGLVHALAAVRDVRVAAPDGGLYVFPCVRGLLRRIGGDDMALARGLLERDGIACVPGSAFGPRGAGHLRIALAAPAERLERVADALHRVATG